MTDRYAVLGNPVAHSKSPQIHTLVAQQTEQDLSYEKLEVPPDQFAETLQRLHREGYLGMNVTLPFKEQACEIAESLSDAARFAQAVNTLIRTETGWHGDNTDGKGLVTDLKQNLGLSLRDKNILILGAGGAVRGILAPLLAQHPTMLHIANRTAEKATALAEKFRDQGTITATGLDGPFQSSFDLIINATSASVSGEMPVLAEGLVQPDTAAYDLFYSDQPTGVMRWADAEGASTTADGIGMLIEQAAESFYLGRKTRPDTSHVSKLISQK